MIKKIIFSDLDGTLLNKNHKFTLFTKTVIKKIVKKEDILFVVNTGRITKSAIALAKKLDCDKNNSFVICNNGAQIYSFENDEFIYDKNLLDDEIKIIHDFFRDKISLVDIHYYSHYSVYVYKETYDSKFWSGIMKANYEVIGSFADISNNADDKISRALLIFNNKCRNEQIEKIIKSLHKLLPDLEVVKQTNILYEIKRKNVDKGYASKILTRKLNLRKEDTISFGDSYNDFPLIKYTGCGIAVKNAIPELKKAADLVVEGNQNNGPAMYLWKKYIKQIDRK